MPQRLADIALYHAAIEEMWRAKPAYFDGPPSLEVVEGVDGQHDPDKWGAWRWKIKVQNPKLDIVDPARLVRNVKPHALKFENVRRDFETAYGYFPNKIPTAWWCEKRPRLKGSGAGEGNWGRFNEGALRGSDRQTQGYLETKYPKTALWFKNKEENSILNGANLKKFF